MFLLLAASSVAAPAFMFVIRFLAPRASIAFDAVGVAAMYGFGLCTARAVFDIVVKDTVMMTEVHKVFYDPVFFGQRGLFRRVRAVYRLVDAVPPLSYRSLKNASVLPCGTEFFLARKP